MLEEKASKLRRINSSKEPILKRNLSRRYMTEAMASKKLSVEMSCLDSAAKLISVQKSDVTFQARASSPFISSKRWAELS